MAYCNNMDILIPPIPVVCIVLFLCTFHWTWALCYTELYVYVTITHLESNTNICFTNMLYFYILRIL